MSRTKCYTSCGLKQIEIVSPFRPLTLGKMKTKQNFYGHLYFLIIKKKLNHARKQIRRNVRRAPGLESVFTSQVVIGGVPLW